jgi:HEAT repeat protein
VRDLQSPNAADRVRAARRLADEGDRAINLVAQIVTAFDDPANTAIRRDLAHAFGQMGARASPAVPSLLKAINDPDVFLRRRIVTALGMIKSEPKMVIPKLIDAFLKDPDRGRDLKTVPVRSATILALGNFGRDASAAIPCLIKALGEMKENSPPEPDYFYVISTLGRIGTDNQQVADALSPLLEKERAWNVRARAAHAIGFVGPRAAASIPKLVLILQTRERTDEVDLAREHAAWALGRMGGEVKETEVKLLVKIALDNKEHDMLRSAAVHAFGDLGPKNAREALPALIAIFESRELGGPVAEVLLRMGRAAVPGLDSLVRNRKDYLIRTNALRMLERIGPEARDARNAVTEALQDRDERVVRAAERAWKAINAGKQNK